MAEVDGCDDWLSPAESGKGGVGAAWRGGLSVRTAFDEIMKEGVVNRDDPFGEGPAQRTVFKQCQTHAPFITVLICRGSRIKTSHGSICLHFAIFRGFFFLFPGEFSLISGVFSLPYCVICV